MASHHDFEAAEYDARIAKTRRAMQVAGLDLLVVSDPSNMAWLTGYDGWSFYVHQAVVLAQDGAPLWWGRAMDAAGAKRTVFMGPDDIAGYDDTYVQNPDAHPMEDLARQIAARFGPGGRIGVELDNYYYSAAAHFALSDALAEARFADATGLVNWQRLIKSEAEITYMRRAAGIVAGMHAHIRAVAEVGLPKNRLVAEIMRVGTEGAGGHWGDYPAIVPMTPSGADASAPHLTWDDTPMRAGEATFFEIAGVHRRYHAPQSRTLWLGTLPDRRKRAEAAVQEGIAAALDAARPGNVAEQVADAISQVLRRHGFEKEGRFGYAIGLSYPPDWGERTVSLRAGDRTRLAPGMTLHLMPALWFEDGGLELTEPILITDDGAECLADTPREICVKA